MKLNPFESSNPMSWQDAAKVSLVLAAAVYCTAFLLHYDLVAILGDVPCFVFESMKFLFSTFFTNFIALAGLSQYEQRKTKDEGGDKAKAT